MKLTVKNLGRIESAEIDVRPLTVFVGPNGTNKTWVAYCLYGLVRTLSANRMPHSITFKHGGRPTGNDSVILNRLEVALSSFFDSMSQEPVPARIVADIDVSPLFQGVDDTFDSNIDAETIAAFLSVPQDQVRDAIASLGYARREFAVQLSSAQLVLEKPLNRLAMAVIRRIGEPAVETVRTGKSWEKNDILGMLFDQLFNLVENVVAFPAERNGLLILNAFAGATTRLLPPVQRDFVAFIRLAQGMANDSPSAVESAWRHLLAKILGGELIYVGEAAQRQLAFKVRDDKTLPLHAASSLSRAIAGLNVYLKQFVKPNDVVIIDELEMNAHPEAQMALVELIAMLVNQNVRVVFTTHSPYIVDHLNNLMEAARVPVEKQNELAKKFALKTPAAFISSEKVAVHAFEEIEGGGKVGVSDVLNRETGLIDWSTFGRVSTRVSNLYADILEAMPE